jgi:ankyrin repeat protein
MYLGEDGKLYKATTAGNREDATKLALIEAAGKNDLIMMKKIIIDQKFAFIDCYTMPYGLCPLSRAANNGCIEAVKFLLEHKADPNFHVTKFQMTKTSQTSRDKHKKEVIGMGPTPLIAACSNPKTPEKNVYAIVKLLIEAGANPDHHVYDEEGIMGGKQPRKPYHYAKHNGFDSVLKDLLLPNTTLIFKLDNYKHPVVHLCNTLTTLKKLKQASLLREGNPFLLKFNAIKRDNVNEYFGRVLHKINYNFPDGRYPLPEEIVKNIIGYLPNDSCYQKIPRSCVGDLIRMGIERGNHLFENIEKKDVVDEIVEENAGFSLKRGYIETNYGEKILLNKTQMNCYFEWCYPLGSKFMYRKDTGQMGVEKLVAARKVDIKEVDIRVKEAENRIKKITAPENNAPKKVQGVFLRGPFFEELLNLGVWYRNSLGGLINKEIENAFK